MAGLQSPALTGSPKSATKQISLPSRSPSFEVLSPSVLKTLEDPNTPSPRPQHPSVFTPVNMNKDTSGTSGSSGSSYQGGAAPGDKKDDGILDAFLPRIESRGQSRQVAPKKDDSKPKGPGNP